MIVSVYLSSAASVLNASKISVPVMLTLSAITPSWVAFVGLATEKSVTEESVTLVRSVLSPLW